MATPTWKGSISFGLVTVPVRMYTAVRSQDVRFRQLSGQTHRRVRQQRVDEETGEEVAYQDLVKGYETSDGRYVVVDPEELKQLDPERSELIQIRDFVALEEIDPIYYERPYYLAPDGESAAKPYRLLVDAMGQEGKVAIASFVMRQREHLAAIRATDDLLVLSTMHHHDEVVDPADLDIGALTENVSVDAREVDMARQLIGSLVTDFEPEAYEDTYRQRLLEYLEAKADDQDVELPEQHVDRGGVIDLTAALERSLERAGRGAAADGETDAQPSSGDTDYAAMTRDQLYDLAQQRELPGRSSMSKTQLVEALRAADAESGAA